MIRITLTGRRRRHLIDTLDQGDPSPMVHELLGLGDDTFLVPIRHARALAEWTGRCHAYFGLGYPTGLVELRSRLDGWLRELDHHPAMWGHGMLGQPRTLPISCWDVPGASYPDRLYAMQPIGREGFLVPTKSRVGGHGGIITAWTFAAAPHGPPRPASTMFRPSFGTRQEVHVDPATQAAAAAHVRAAILGIEPEAHPPERPLEEDGSDVPQTP